MKITVNELINKLNLQVFVQGNSEQIIHSFYVGDFLSWVLGKAQQDSCWFTIMSNINVSGVACMVGCACVVLCEGVKPDDALLTRMKNEGICLLGTQLAIFEAVRLI